MYITENFLIQKGHFDGSGEGIETNRRDDVRLFVSDLVEGGGVFISPKFKP